MLYGLYGWALCVGTIKDGEKLIIEYTKTVYKVVTPPTTSIDPHTGNPVTINKKMSF